MWGMRSQFGITTARELRELLIVNGSRPVATDLRPHQLRIRLEALQRREQLFNLLVRRHVH